MNIFRILDPFTLTLVTVVLLASFFPAEGDFVPVVEGITTAAIALLFLCTGQSSRAKPLSLAAATGVCTCG